MELLTNTAGPLPKGHLNADKLKAFFSTHLNRIYCAKSHLHARLPEIRVHAHFTDLTHAVTETITDVEKQISRMDEIFSLLGIKPDFEDCKGIVGLIDDTFSAIYEESHDPELRDLSILFYLQNIESIEMASFKMLNMVSKKTGKNDVVQLLRENFDEASEDLVLLQQITAKYFL